MKVNISLASCLFTPLEHVSCHITHCKESHWMKKKCFKTIRDGSKKSWIEFKFNSNSIFQIQTTIFNLLFPVTYLSGIYVVNHIERN